MGNYKSRRRCKLLKGPSILRVFGASYKYKEEAKEERKNRRKGQKFSKRSCPLTTQHSVRDILTPMGNKR